MLSISDSVLTDGVAASPSRPSPAPMIRTKNEISAMAAARASFTNQHCQTRRSDNFVRYDGNTSAEAYSPRYREMQTDREMKRLKSQLNETEDQLVRVECELAQSKSKIESLIEEIAIKKSRIRDMEKNEKVFQRTQEEMESKFESMSKQLEQMQRHHEIQKERLMAYKENEVKWEAKKTDFEEIIKEKNNTVLQLERKLRDVNDELLNSWNALKNTESQCTGLQREVEELTRNLGLQREEYQASISDWRNRLEKTVAENLATCAADMERNTNIAREMREKTEEVERLQQLLEIEKKQVQLVAEELTANFRKESETVTSKLAALEAELARRDELQEKSEKDRGEALQNLEELRAQVKEGEKLVSKYKRDLEALSSENGRLDSERIEAVSELERKKEGLKEAMMIMDGLREEIAACLTENSYRLPMKFAKAGKEADMNLKLSNVIEVIEAYGSQFEQLEMRLAIEDKRQRQRQPISEVDVTETIGDLRYRLFAASQKLSMYEKEREEWRDILLRFEEREAQAKQKNSDLANDVERWLQELDELREEKMCMQDKIAEYHTELGTKAVQLDELAKSLDDSQRDNALHIQLISTLKEKYEREINDLRKKEVHYMEEYEALRLLDIKKEKEVQVLLERISSLERAVQPCQMENINLHMKVSSLKKENEEYKITIHKLKAAEIERCARSSSRAREPVTESRDRSDTITLLRRSQGRAHHNTHSTKKTLTAQVTPTSESAVTSQSTSKAEGGMKPATAVNEKNTSAHRFLKRTSFYQMSRTLNEVKPH